MSAPVEVKTTCRRSFHMGLWRISEHEPNSWFIGHAGGRDSRDWVHGSLSIHRDKLNELRDVIDTILALP